MAEPFLSEIRIFSFNYAPRGWAFCNGQLLPINQNQALFALLGTIYGGNGQTNFALPDLRNRIPMDHGSRPLGERAGADSHTLTLSEMPMHTHMLSGSSSQGNSSFPVDFTAPASNNILAADPGNAYSAAASNLAALNPASVTNVGGSQAHNNMQPYLNLNFCIALQGIFPSQN